MEVINLQTEMIKLIAAKRDELEDFASAYEGGGKIKFTFFHISDCFFDCFN